MGTVAGTSGDDTLRAGADDTLTGGAGRDVFVASDFTDTVITDLAVGETIRFEDVFAATPYLSDYFSFLPGEDGEGLTIAVAASVGQAGRVGEEGPIRPALEVNLIEVPEAFHVLNFGETFSEFSNVLVTEIYAGDGTGGIVPSAYSPIGTVTLTAASGGALLGTTGIDVVSGGEGADVLTGLDGDDIMGGGFGADQIIGDAGSDQLAGDWGDDTLSGGGGDDEMLGGTGSDAMFGDLGRDRIAGGEGHDVIEGGAGNDCLFGEIGDDVLRGGVGDDLVSGDRFATVRRGGIPQAPAGSDMLEGGAGADTLEGGAGDDVLLGGEGDDLLFGDVNPDGAFYGFWEAGTAP